MKVLLVVPVLLFFLPGYRSLDQDISVSIELSSRPGSFAVIPEETDSLLVNSNFDLIHHTSVVIEGIQSDLDNFVVSNCGQSCTITVTSSDFSAPKITVQFLFNGTDQDTPNKIILQSLTVLVRTSLNYSCLTYPTPVEFSSTITSYNFTCTPPTGMNISNVVWRSFLMEEDMEMFQAGLNASLNTIISSSTTFSFEGSMNETLIVTQSNAENWTNVAFFYVPSFSVQGQVNEFPTAETSIYLIPEITTMKPEFSFEAKLNQGNFDDILCETRSFPPAIVEWTLQNEEYPNGTNLAMINKANFVLVNMGSLETRTLTIDAIINMTNLQYDDDGNFTCNCMNRYGSSMQWARLRVKSRLRPLWPALGILVVTILVAMFMSGSYIIEKVTEKHKRARISRSDSNSIDHGTERGHRLAAVSHRTNNGSNAHSKDSHSSVKRLSSAKPLLEETTTTTL